MRRLEWWTGLAAVLAGLVSASWAQVREQDGQWTTESPALRLSVDGSSGAWQVYDKRCGRAWRQPAVGTTARCVLPIPRLNGPVTVDGVLADWPAGAGIDVDSKLVADATTTGGDADCSAQFRLAWDDAGWWLAAAVTDDDVVGAAPGANLWDVDAVELWLGEEHWGLAPNGNAVEIACFSSPGMAQDCRAASARSATGWTLEVFIPWARIAAARGKPLVGTELPLAFGVDDADGKPGRQCQLFYPPGYKHRLMETHALARLSEPGAACQAWTETRAVTDTTVRSVKPMASPGPGVELQIEYSGRGNTALPLTVRLSLLSDGDTVLCEIAGDPAATLRDIAVPLPFVLDAPEGVLVIPHQSGMLYGVDELGYNGKSLGGMISMPWFGAADLASGQGYIGILDTPDDACFRGVKVQGDGRDVLAVRPIFLSQKGTLGYARRIIYHFVDRGGYVALAKRYRAYAKDKGLVKTLAEKRKDRPAIDRLVGAVDVYTCDPFSIAEDLKRLGIERALVYGYSKDHVRQMNEWGYLTTRYDIYTDMYEPDSPPAKWERCEGFKFPDDVIKTAAGSNQVGWCPIPNLKTGKPDPSYVICWTCGLRTLRQKMPGRLNESPFLAYFLDCVSSAGLYECYDATHPLTRTEDRETRFRQFAVLSKELGLVVGSEAGRDWAVPVADYFEGLMSTATWCAAPPTLGDLPFEVIEPTPQYEEFGTNPVRRVPLFQLVYGDCAETTFWWGDNNHRMPGLWAQKDLLDIIHAAMPLWVIWKPQMGLFWGNPERFKECYDNVCRWRRAVGYSEMTGHEHLSKDRLVQKSSFANGAAVIVNFAREPRALADGTALPPRSFLILGDPATLSGLPVGKPVQVSDAWQPKEFVATGNTGFEEARSFWSPAAGMALDVQASVVHGGAQAARLSGTQSGSWSYASAVSVPLRPGAKYVVRGWLRVDALDKPSFAPCLKCGVNNPQGQWLANFPTSCYDVSKLGMWQPLECTFTAPDGATTGCLALEKRTTDATTATLYLDDVELVPAP